MVKYASAPPGRGPDAPADPWHRLSGDAPGEVARRRRFRVLLLAGCLILALLLWAGMRQPLYALDPLQRALTPAGGTVVQP